jgi:pyruvate/2-oxoglutarate dehydrogenase complex dihydrolipoamide dehydrogenase (E3) component
MFIDPQLGRVGLTEREGKLTATAMADAIFTHPLLAEGLNTLFATFDA